MNDDGEKGKVTICDNKVIKRKQKEKIKAKKKGKEKKGELSKKVILQFVLQDATLFMIIVYELHVND